MEQKSLVWGKQFVSPGTEAESLPVKDHLPPGENRVYCLCWVSISSGESVTGSVSFFASGMLSSELTLAAGNHTSMQCKRNPEFHFLDTFTEICGQTICRNKSWKGFYIIRDLISVCTHNWDKKPAGKGTIPPVSAEAREATWSHGKRPHAFRAKPHCRSICNSGMFHFLSPLGVASVCLERTGCCCWQHICKWPALETAWGAQETTLFSLCYPLKISIWHGWQLIHCRS